MSNTDERIGTVRLLTSELAALGPGHVLDDLHLSMQETHRFTHAMYYLHRRRAKLAQELRQVGSELYELDHTIALLESVGPQ